MTNSNNRKYRLGLDLGTNSIGWAAIVLDDNDSPCGVLDMGVRIFPDGRKPTDKTSNAVDRRLARGQRRRRDRYLKRRSKLMDVLVAFGLMPTGKDERKALERLDPYKLRACALDGPLSPFELGRSLFHIDQRRGFKSNRKAATDDENEARKTRADISLLRQSIEEGGARTLGEFLAWRHDKHEMVRARPDMGLYPDRAMYEAEFDAIRESQESRHSLSPEQWDRLRDIIFFQRDLKPVDPGWCQFEFQSKEKRAARALPVFQEFRILTEVNNLRLRVGSGPDRPLNDDERSRALQRLRSGLDINLQKPPKRLLDLSSGVQFNLSHGGREKIEGDQTAKRLKHKDLFGKDWPSRPLDERNEIVRLLLETEDPETVRQKAVTEWGLVHDNAVAVANVSLVSGYGNLSEKAIRKLLPHMEEGIGYYDAVVAAGYDSDSRSAEASEKLPYYGEVLERDVVDANSEKDPRRDGEVARYGRIPNPTVHIGLNQLRRMVNQLIEAYGKPEEIVVELARDLKMNRKQKQNYERQQREGGQRNEHLMECLQSAEIPVTSDVLRKLRLWEEQGPPQARRCPYTGDVISFSMAVSAATEIDHILPFSKTLDDSPANKVVCIARANRDKGDRSPYEAFGHSPAGYDYQAILDRADELLDNERRKRRRFQPDAMQQFEDEDHFLDRQLNETRYLSRTARTYLAHLYDEKTEGRQHVRVIPGRMTALLRRGWGLQGILRAPEIGEIAGKQRDDHRHHAIDAFVVANTTQGLLQRFARASGSHYDPEGKLKTIAGQVPPWEGFDRSDLQPFLDHMIVSYKPDHGTRGKNGRATTGQLHNETAYGLVELAESGPSKVVVRKKLSDFKKKGDFDSVRDSTLREALLELWDKTLANGGKPADFAERAATEGVMLNDRHQIVRRVRVLDEQTVIPITDRDGRPYKGYMPGGNEFADVWRMRDGSWRIVAVTTFDANQPDFDIECFRPVTSRGKHKGKTDPAAKRIMRLHKDDMGAFGEGPDRRIVRVRKMTNARSGVSVFMDEHNEANVPERISKKDIKEKKYSARQLQQQGFRKVGVDEIGRVQDPGPRT